LLITTLILCNNCLASELKTQMVNGIKWTYSVWNSSTAHIENYSVKNLGDGTGLIYYKSVIPKTTTGAIVVPSKLGGYPVVAIEQNAFQGCSQITSVVFPTNNVISFPTCSMFDGCDKLTSVTMPEKILDNRFGAYNFLGAKAIEKILAPPRSESFSSYDGVLYNKDMSKMLIVPYAKTELAIPTSVKSFATTITLAISDRIKKISVESLEQWLAISFGGVESSYGQRNPLSLGAELYVNGELLTSCDIPDGTTTIGYNTFYGCASITNISIPNSVREINSGAFTGCTNITSVVIPSGVNELDTGAFDGCSSLKTITLMNGCTLLFGFNSCFPFAENVKLLGDWECVPNSMFSRCYKLKQVTMPDSVGEIGAWAFANCSSLSEIEIPSSVTNIGSYAFYRCYALKQFVAASNGTSVGEIGAWAFAECKSLTEIEIPSTVTNVGSHAFYRCDALKQIVATNNENYASVDGVLYTADKTVLICCPCGATKLTMPYGVKTVGETACAECKKLRSIDFPETLGWVSANAFNNCTKLGNVKFNSYYTLQEIGEGAFAGCSSLTNIESLISRPKVHKTAFDGCPVASAHAPTEIIEVMPRMYLQKVTYPVGEREIGGCAGARYLESVNIPTTVCEICTDAFGGCLNLKNINLPDSITTIGRCAFTNSGLETVMFPPKVKIVSADAFYQCNALTSVVLNAGIEEVGCEAFAECSKLSEIDIPSSIRKISDDSFYYCTALNKVKLHWGLEEIGDCAFYACKSLMSVKLPSGIKRVGKSAFAMCDELRVMTIPPSIVSIGDDAIEGCKKFRMIYINEGSEKNVWVALRVKELEPASMEQVFENRYDDFHVRSDWGYIYYDYVPSCAIYDMDELYNVFSANSEVIENIRTENQLSSFNTFLSLCGIESCEGLPESSKRWAYASYKLSEIMKTPKLFGAEPKLEISECSTDDFGVSFTVMLNEGTEPIELLKDRMAEKICIGTQLNQITEKPTILSLPSEDGKSLRFVIKKPDANSAFVKIKID